MSSIFQYRSNDLPGEGLDIEVTQDETALNGAIEDGRESTEDEEEMDKERDEDEDGVGDRSEFITIKMSSPSSPADENENEIR